MKNKEQDYTRDLADIRLMMERSSKFLSLSGLSGIMAGVSALVGAYIAITLFQFNPQTIFDVTVNTQSIPANVLNVIWLAVLILIIALSSTVFLSHKNAQKRGEKLWNTTSKLILFHMSIPLFTGGILILVLLSKGFIGLVAPLTLLFYGLALVSISKFTYDDMKSLGLIQIVLGLLATYFIEYGMILWTLGFGVIHIIYGVYMHYRYER